MFVFRNNTVELFFPKGYQFSGYDDISTIPLDANGYIWFYQLPVGINSGTISDEVRGFSDKFALVLSGIPSEKPVYAFTMESRCFTAMTGDDFGVVEAVSAYNLSLINEATRYQNLKIIDISDFTTHYPDNELIDWKYWFISQMGINPRLAKDFMGWWDNKLNEIALIRKKCLVLDLDNTLWGGVVGEDGFSGIQIGGDYPGKAFTYFQKAILELSRKGVILAVCSKNNEADVFEVWDKNPFLVLGKDNFAAWRINWSDKVTNIKELAEELNISLDSFVFVDDNPTERELVRHMLPMVSTPDFPDQPYMLPVFVNELIKNYFRVYSITAEDKIKTEQYKANSARAREQRNFNNFSDFLHSLDLCLTIENANEFSIPRIAQLTQKTNQFNLTTKRYTESDIRGFLSNGWNIFTLSVSDKFGDNGITGVAMIDGDYLDSFLLSCRILGKGIEFAFIKQVMRFAKESGVIVMRAEYIPTLKNAQVKDFYDRCGFVCINESNADRSYRIDLMEADLSVEDYYRIKLK